MTRILAAYLVAAAFLGAPQAAADPADLIPYCSGDQTPVDDNCRPMAHQEFTHGGSGTNPDVPFGTNPGLQPVT